MSFQVTWAWVWWLQTRPEGGWTGHSLLSKWEAETPFLQNPTVWTVAEHGAKHAVFYKQLSFLQNRAHRLFMLWNLSTRSKMVQEMLKSSPKTFNCNSRPVANSDLPESHGWRVKASLFVDRSPAGPCGCPLNYILFKKGAGLLHTRRWSGIWWSWGRRGHGTVRLEWGSTAGKTSAFTSVCLACGHSALLCVCLCVFSFGNQQVQGSSLPCRLCCDLLGTGDSGLWMLSPLVILPSPTPHDLFYLQDRKKHSRGITSVQKQWKGRWWSSGGGILSWRGTGQGGEHWEDGEGP